MGIRIQPTDIEVPAGNPFENDLLDRKQSIEALTRLVGAVDGQCVLAVDAPWGTGKTTFLKMWTQYLRNDGFPVVEFNAWETDFSEDPLIALTAEITRGLEEHLPSNSGVDVTEIRKRAGKILLAIGSNAIRVATQGVVDSTALTANDDDETSAEVRMKTHLDIQRYICDFKESLADAADRVRDIDGSRSIVVVIDELDRCRPSYAIKLLEVAKHLFAVDNIIFVLATNRAALAHSVRAVYGSEFDAEGYLRRFFDIDFRLSSPSRDKFIQTTFKAAQVADYFDNRAYRHEEYAMPNLLMESLRAPSLSLRDIAQSVRRFVLVFGSLPSLRRPLLSMATLALMLRTIDTELYFRFIHQEVTDKQVVERVSEILYANDRSHVSVVFEILVAIAGHRGSFNSRQLHSSLFAEYAEVVSSGEAPNGFGEEYAAHAYAVLEQSKSYLGYAPVMRSAFEQAVQCLELISRDFTDE